MRVLWEQDTVELDPEGSGLEGFLARTWRFFRPPLAPGSKESRPLRLKVLSRRNLAMWVVLVSWALYYFTFQFHNNQEPYYPDNPLFSTWPNEFLQDYRNVFLDYFFSYAWVILFICVGLIYALVAFASEEDFFRYGMVFWVAWLAQSIIQLTFNLASPMRDPDRGLDFIREEVFPFSENLVGIKYGAFPSGHVGVTLLLYLVARERGIPWVMRFAVVCECVLFFTVIYLGEHYLIDAVASAILYPAIFLIVTKLIPTVGSDGDEEEKHLKDGVPD